MNEDELKKQTDEAIERAERGATEEWKADALDAVSETALNRSKFTADDVWDRGLEVPRQSRALGPIMRRAYLYGWIVPTGEFVPTRKENCHRQPIRVWKSLIYKKGIAA